MPQSELASQRSSEKLGVGAEVGLPVSFRPGGPPFLREPHTAAFPWTEPFLSLQGGEQTAWGRDRMAQFLIKQLGNEKERKEAWVGKALSAFCLWDGYEFIRGYLRILIPSPSHSCPWSEDQSIRNQGHIHWLLLCGNWSLFSSFCVDLCVMHVVR